MHKKARSEGSTQKPTMRYSGHVEVAGEKAEKWLPGLGAKGGQ